MIDLDKLTSYMENKLGSSMPLSEIAKVAESFYNSTNSTLVITRDLMLHNTSYEITENADITNVSAKLFSELMDNLNTTALLFLNKTTTGSFINIPIDDLEMAAVNMRRCGRLLW